MPLNVQRSVNWDGTDRDYLDKRIKLQNSGRQSVWMAWYLNVYRMSDFNRQSSDMNLGFFNLSAGRREGGCGAARFREERMLDRLSLDPLKTIDI